MYGSDGACVVLVGRLLYVGPRGGISTDSCYWQGNWQETSLCQVFYERLCTRELLPRSEQDISTNVTFNLQVVQITFLGRRKEAIKIQTLSDPDTNSPSHTTHWT